MYLKSSLKIINEY